MICAIDESDPRVFRMEILAECKPAKTRTDHYDMFFLVLHPVRPRSNATAYFFGTQLGTVFPAFFLVPICSYPSQHGLDGFFDAAFFLDAVFLVVAIRFNQTSPQPRGDRGSQGDRVYAQRRAIIAACPRPRREGGAQELLRVKQQRRCGGCGRRCARPAHRHFVRRPPSECSPAALLPARFGMRIPQHLLRVHIRLKWHGRCHW